MQRQCRVLVEYLTNKMRATHETPLSVALEMVAHICDPNLLMSIAHFLSLKNIRLFS